MTNWDERKLNRVINSTMAAEAKEMLTEALDRLAKETLILEGKEVDLITPDRVQSASTEVVEGTTAITPTVLEMDDTVEETKVEDEFLRDLQEEALLQSLPHKKITEKKERVLELEHRNVRRLLVVRARHNAQISHFK